MSFVLLATLVGVIGTFLFWLVFVTAILSFFLSPYHPLREALDRLVDPMLNPIRRLIPMAGPVDFSPWILVILIQLITQILRSILLSLN